ncbi:hypothetical protein OG194_45755 [Streptomyces sp. NBC_01288]|uniref:hypothetical protein n=1 Tax=Streptomyces sp. NBC_01288 TaxID=2903814 RepID=UPI002E12674B|nr:hypothetical protein OG194_45755 [Streptomyces sp. NBC_01288]
MSPGLIGAAMLGTAPGLFTVGRARRWEEVRTPVYPLGIVLIRLFAVTLLNADRLYIARGGSIVPVLFSLGWLFTLGLLCVAVLVTLTCQHLTQADPPPPRPTPLGVGVLGALAEGDLDRTRPALLALPGTAIATAVVLAFRASGVNWSSGPALGLLCMLTGLLLAGTGGRLLLGSVSGDRRAVAAAGAVRRGTPR